METIALVHVAILGMATTLSAALGTYAIRTGDVPGRLPFAAFMASVAVWTGAYAAGLLTTDPGLRVALEAVAWFGRATVHVWFLLFALAYTGYDRLVTRRTVAGLLAVPVAMVGLVWTHPWHDLVWATEPRVVFHDGMALVVAGVGPAFWANVVYAYVLIAIAAVLLVRLVVVSEYLYVDQSALLVVGVAAPFIGNAATVFPPHPIPGFDYTPYGFAVTGLAFGYALFRARLFDLVPATRALGRNAAIAQLDAGVLVVDTDRRIIYCNEAGGGVFDCSPGDLIGRSADALADGLDVDFGPEDALAELERGDRVYEIRASPITDRRDRQIGHTLVIHDVTARKHRERELSLVNDVNRMIRGVNRALVSATSRAEIERSLCERVLDADIYQRACVADVPTWTGEADRWAVGPGDGDPTPPVLEDGADADFERDVLDPATQDALPTVATPEGTWVVVPLVNGRTVYGALGLFTDRAAIGDRERAVLRELGETVGYAIDAVETREILAADEVVELDLESRDPAAPLVAATAATAGRLEVTSLVSRGDGDHVAYVRVDGDPAPVADHLASGPAATARTVREDEHSGLLEWRLTGDSLLGTLASEGAHVRGAAGADGVVSYEVDVTTTDAVRPLVDHVRERFPETEVTAKRERTHPIETDAISPEIDLEALTDRQREAVEVAYRAGYFNWPRDSSAEELADAMDIAAPTFHSHLRKAQSRLLDGVFESDEEE